MLAVARAFRLAFAFLFRFFAGFCLVANGVYLGAGSFLRIGDAADLLRHGAPKFLFVPYALVTVIPGLWLWHRLGPRFGLGPSKGKVDRRAAIGVLALLLLVVALELLLSGRG